MKPITTLLLFLIHSLAPAVFPADVKDTSTTWLWEKGLATARTQDPDAALPYLKKALSKNIGSDSLYYLWAEIYLYKEIPDTALVLNLSIRPLETSALQKLVIEQRYLLYMSLGWDEKANALYATPLPSTKKQPFIKKLLPDASLYIAAGGYLEKYAADKDYPNPRLYDSLVSENNGAGNAALRCSWNIPFLPKQKLQFGGRFRYSGTRFSLANEHTRKTDSADISAGGFLRYTGFSDKIMAQYQVSRKYDYRDDKTWIHAGTLRYAFVGSSSAGTIEAGYQFEAPIKEHYYYSLLWWDYFFGDNNDIGFSLLASGFSVAAFAFTEPTLMFYAKNQQLYFDPACTQMLPARTLIDNYDSLKQYYDFKRIIPLGFRDFAPGIRYERELSSRFSAGSGCGYNVTWYPEKYTWLDFTGKADDYTNTLLFNTNDSTMYVLHSTTITSRAFTTLPSPLRSQRRVDQSVSFNLFARCSFERFGDIALDATIRRTFSSLDKSAPVDIQKWYGDIMLTWFISYKPDKGK